MRSSSLTRRAFIAGSAGAFTSLASRPLLAAPLAPSGTIAFVCGNFGDGDQRKILLINADGSRLRTLTQTEDRPGEDHPAWSRDSRSLAFTVRERIARCNSEGEDLVLLTPEAMEAEAPCWSPDDSMIAFNVWLGLRQSSQIFTMRADGTQIKQVTQGKGHRWLPSWSADADRIVYEADLDGNREVFSMAPDGSDVRNLTHHAATDHSPECSPDGKKIALMAGRDFGNAEICVMAMDGTGIVNLTKNTARDSEPAWSPDGQWIAFARSTDDLDETPMDIYIMRADGTQVTNLTKAEGPIHNWAPSWG